MGGIRSLLFIGGNGAKPLVAVSQSDCNQRGPEALELLAGTLDRNNDSYRQRRRQRNNKGRWPLSLTESQARFSAHGTLALAASDSAG